VRRNLLLLAGVAAGAVGTYLLNKRGQTIPGAGPGPDPRAEELRRKLAEARDTAADEDDFEAAGMAGETQVEEPGPMGEPPPAPSINPAAAMSGGDVEDVRRQIHEEARRSTEEMRRSEGPSDK
jgi:hypothetical protein